MTPKRIANVPPELKRMLVPIDQVKPLDGNRRRGDVDEVRASLRHHGQYKPIIARRETSEVLVGNHTTQAAREEGWTHIAVLWRSEPSDAEAKRLALVDNRTSDLAEWDVAGLAADLTELSNAGGLAGTGFSEEAMQETLEIARKLAASEAAALLGAGGEDTPPGPAPKKPKTRLGDLITMNEHRLVCGDAATPDAYAALLTDVPGVDLVWTDPPYGVAYDPESRVSYFSPERLEQPFGEILGDEKVLGPTYATWLAEVLSNATAPLREGGPVYVCHAATMMEWAARAYREAGLYLASQIIWAKTVLVFGRGDYHWMHEPILYGWKPGAAHRWLGDRTQTTLQVIAADHYNADADGTLHPNQKPIDLIRPHLLNSTLPGDYVLDPFAGSGATLIACETLQRRALLLELDPAYCDVIVDRWERHTGEQATRPARRKRAPAKKKETT